MSAANPQAPAVAASRLALTCAFMAACASSPADRTASSVAVPPPPANAADASYDWHALLPAPWGTLLKAMPMPLHEVLLFQDESHGIEARTGEDCYTGDSPPPLFLGRPPQEFLLCFEHDRLNRVEAAVRVDAGEAEAVVTRACGRWLKDALTPPASIEACAGRDADTDWRARLSLMPGAATASLTLMLAAAPRQP